MVDGMQSNGPTIHHSQWSRFDPPFVALCRMLQKMLRIRSRLSPAQFAALALLTCEQWANILHKDDVALCKKRKNYFAYLTALISRYRDAAT